MWVTGAEVAVGAAAVVAALAPTLAVLLQALVVALACAQKAEAVHIHPVRSRRHTETWPET